MQYKPTNMASVFIHFNNLLNSSALVMYIVHIKRNRLYVLQLFEESSYQNLLALKFSLAQWEEIHVASKHQQRTPQL